MAPTRALRADASSSWGGRWECGLGGHPPMLGTHLPFQVWPDRALKGAVLSTYDCELLRTSETG